MESGGMILSVTLRSLYALVSHLCLTGLPEVAMPYSDVWQESIFVREAEGVVIRAELKRCMSIERSRNRNEVSRESPDKEVNRRPNSLKNLEQMR